MLKNIPKVDKILEWPALRAASQTAPRPVVIEAVRSVLSALRGEILAGPVSPEAVTEKAITARILREIASSSAPSLKRVINGTGIVIHTNLGRSPLPPAAKSRLCEIAFGYSNLEFDLGQRERGSRYSHVEPLLCRITGAEAALVVNNNAAAVLLALAAVAADREVIVSRGELVEIGGSFRIPDVMRQSGAILREVGTTNRTHARDYRHAVQPLTGLLLKVHTSNFAVVGFTKEVSTAELVKMGEEVGLPVMADMGSGSLVDLAAVNVPGEPTVQSFVQAGADIITFSGDKLLGGPQAGIIVGRKKYIDMMKKHPLLRALRIDKLTLVALEETLRLYLDERKAMTSVPVLRMLSESAKSVEARGRTMARKLRKRLPGVRVSLVRGVSQPGGGSFPLMQLETSLLALDVEGVRPEGLEKCLREREVPVLGLIRQDTFLLDVRTLNDADLPEILAGLEGNIPPRR